MDKANTILHGTGVSEGIAFGTTWAYLPEDPSLSMPAVPPVPEEEQARLAEALAEAREQLTALADRIASDNPEEAGIFLAQKELLQDPEMEEAVRDLIESGKTAELAVYEGFSMFADILAAVDDELISMRAGDIRDIRGRVIRNLLGMPQPDLSSLPPETILVAEDLLPSDTAMIDRENVLGIVTEKGNPTSHTAILARSFGIPAVLGVLDAAAKIPSGVPAVIDGGSGAVICEPSEETKAEMMQQKAAIDHQKQEEAAYLTAKAETLDGTDIAVGINVGGEPEDFASCDYCGLYRTEFLFLEQDQMPDEELQLREYRKMLDASGGKTVTLRTMDIGGDKKLPYLEMKPEDNPFLGIRAVRFCLQQPELFRTQLRAALRASVYGDLRIMFPMIGSLDDIREVKKFTASVMEELRAEQIPFNEDIKLGIMIEIPSIAEMSEEAAREVDFASIGTNDLCQYLCAADRMNADATPYYQTFSPAMIRCLSRIAQGFAKVGTELSVCGEMAGTREGIPLLIGLGYRKLSMNPKNLAMAKSIICRMKRSEAETLAEQALRCCTQDEVMTLLKQKGQG